MNKLVQYVVATSMVLVIGCAKQPTPNEQLAMRAEQEVRDSLKDPLSAKFKGVKASAKANCIYGQVLAKNSMGAYTGYHDFVWINGQSYINADMTATSPTSDLEALNAYVENQIKCADAAKTDSVEQRASDVPDA